MGYASDAEHALVNMRLYLPQDWATDSKRRKKCHVPRTIRFPGQIRHNCTQVVGVQRHRPAPRKGRSRSDRIRSDILGATKLYSRSGFLNENRAILS